MENLVEEPTIEELMEMSDEERRHLVMSVFGTIFPQVQDLLVRLSINPAPQLRAEDIPILVQALYLASIEYSRYMSNMVPEGESIH